MKHRLSDEAHWFWKSTTGLHWVLFCDIVLWAILIRAVIR